MVGTVLLAHVGDPQAPPPVPLNTLASLLEERFLFAFDVLDTVPMPAKAYHLVKKQHSAMAIIEELQSLVASEGQYLLGVTSVDLFAPSLNFVFSHSQPEARVGVVSTHRLRPEYYGNPAEDDLLFQRVLKEAVHELGHVLGSKHCFQSRCVMAFSNSIFDTDRKDSFFCGECERRLKQLLSSR